MQEGCAQAKDSPSEAPTLLLASLLTSRYCSSNWFRCAHASSLQSGRSTAVPRTLGVKLAGSVSARSHTAVRPERRDATRWLKLHTHQALKMCISPASHHPLCSPSRSENSPKINKCGLVKSWI